MFRHRGNKYHLVNNCQWKWSDIHVLQSNYLRSTLYTKYVGCRIEEMAKVCPGQLESPLTSLPKAKKNDGYGGKTVTTNLKQVSQPNPVSSRDPRSSHIMMVLVMNRITIKGEMKICCQCQLLQDFRCQLWWALIRYQVTQYSSSVS